MHVEALTEHAAEIFPNFGRFKKFYLVGGTALALQIGHRRSVDFDFFTSEELPPNLLKSAKNIFAKSSIVVTYSSKEQLNLLIDDIKTTFLEYPYPLLEPLTNYKEVPLASIREIAAMKAYTIGKRLSYKDYVDWYFLLKENRVNLTEIISLAQKKFGGEFNDRLFLGQLVSLNEIPFQPIDFLRDKVDQETIQYFLEKTVQSIGL